MASRKLKNRLRMEGDPPLLLVQRLHVVRVRLAGDVHIAGELNIAPERNCAELPAGSTGVVEAHQFRAEADRELLHADAAPPPDQVMTHLMNEDYDRQNQEERQDRADQ
jgi:hypothetical protein